MNDEHEPGYEPRDDIDFITQFGKGIVVGILGIIIFCVIGIYIYSNFLVTYFK